MQSHNLTRREKHVLIVFITLMLLVALITLVSQTDILTFNAFIASYEPHIILALGLPLGLYLAFDKER